VVAQQHPNLNPNPNATTKTMNNTKSTSLWAERPIPTQQPQHTSRQGRRATRTITQAEQLERLIKRFTVVRG